MKKKGRPKKQISVEFRTMKALYYETDFRAYDSFIGKDNGYEGSEYSPMDYEREHTDVPIEQMLDTIELEKFIYFLPVEEVIIILFKNMGFTASEIMQLLDIQDSRKYYDITDGLKVHFYLFKNLHIK